MITEPDLLLRLQRKGAVRLKRVAYRMNRSTLWSLTQNGTALNLHEAYSRAPDYVYDAFARIAVAKRRSPGYHAATRTVREWPGIEEAMRDANERYRENAATKRRSKVSCSGTEEEREQLKRLYDRFNRERFEGRLPSELPLRLSNRMRSRLGHVVPRERDGARMIEEIAINRRLLRSGNEEVFEATLLHEMAHVAAYLFDNDAGHGRAWKEWAFKVGCNPLACTSVALR